MPATYITLFVRDGATVVAVAAVAVAADMPDYDHLDDPDRMLKSNDCGEKIGEPFVTQGIWMEATVSRITRPVVQPSECRGKQWSRTCSGRIREHVSCRQSDDRWPITDYIGKPPD